MKLRNDLAALLPRLREEDLHKFCALYEKYAPHFDVIERSLYRHLGADDQRRFLVWWLKRWAKIDLVNAVERGLYDATIERVKREARATVALDGATYHLRDFRSQGHDFQLLGYEWFLGVHDVQYNQYEQGVVQLEPDDVIIDAGAFIGDTAVFFHHKLGGRCQIHSFELLDENMALLMHNLERNGVHEDQVVLNKLALTDAVGDEIVINGGASQGSTSIFGKSVGGERVQTITLDEYVIRTGLSRVDFIKMDIEGSEALALKGAQHTIGHFEPKLAICLYHKWDDIFTIPPLIEATGVDYRYTFRWVQLSDGWEAVLLACPASRARQVAPAPAGPGAADARPAPDLLAEVLTVLTRGYAKKWGQADALWRQKLAATAPRAAPAVTAATVEAAA